MKYNYDWTLKDAVFTKDKGKVFSCFACGGGSTMGYKLAGFDVIGCNEIDKKMMTAYVANHNPKYLFLEPIQTFKDRDDLPEELYNLDILDGSPPCSSFSEAGSREKCWGKKKKFREGQAEQVLDTLFFDFIELGKKLQPKIIIAENVRGLLKGSAVKYVDRILTSFDDAGYFVDFKLLDSSVMGVPQIRRRVFFYAVRKDLYRGAFSDLFGTRPILDLSFNENAIPFKMIHDKRATHNTLGDHLSILMKELRDGEKDLRNPTKRIEGKENNFGNKIQYLDKVCYSILASDKDIIFGENRYKSKSEFEKAGTYPSDYNYISSRPSYLIGMSVPPVMMAQIATRIYDQWLTEMPDKGLTK
jgi:DNA (cytosine-5)-methyltransferase 1